MNCPALPCPAFRLLALLALAHSATSQAPIQISPGTPREFDVASIRPSKPNAVAKDARMAFRTGRFEALNVTLHQLVDYISGFSGNVRGGPKWAELDRYDVVAKVEADVEPNERLRMVRALLEERFKLSVHHEAKEQLAFALVSKSEGAKWVPSKEEDATSIQSSQGRLIFQAASTDYLAKYLHQIWNATVFNRTGITGRFNFSLDMNVAASEYAATIGDSIQPAQPQSPTFGDFLRVAIEGLGFKVQTEKVTVEVTVIDHAERPTEN